MGYLKSECHLHVCLEDTSHRLFLALHGEGVAHLLSEIATCPGLFYPTTAQDGVLSRIRVQGGILTTQQCEAVAALADQFGGGYVQITNRANVQIREIQTGIATDALTRLQKLGLASPVAEVDPIRNIMSSPTAGIDRQALLDSRPLVSGWNHYLTTRLDLAVLSPKFSVCFDGGEAVSVRDRPNDIGLVAVKVDGLNVYFRLHLSVGERGDAPRDVGVLVKPEESLLVLAALAEVYRDYTIQQSGDSVKTDSPTKSLPERCANRPVNRRKPRLRELLQDLGVEAYLQAVEGLLPFPWRRCQTTHDALPLASYRHLGVHPQRQSGVSYIGVVLPLGRLDTPQLRGLAALAALHGSGMLRLTPWQNLLITDIPNQRVAEVQQAIEHLGLHGSATHPCSAIVACSGKTGCLASATDTKGHALTLAAHLERRITLDRPVNIHFSGCEKSCAQHHSSDIALLGVAIKGTEAYHVYVGNDGSTFGRELYRECSFEQLPNLIEHMLSIYQDKRLAYETFGEFTNRYAIDELKKLFDRRID